MSREKSSCGQHSDQLSIVLTLQLHRRVINGDDTSAEHVNLLDGVRLGTCDRGESVFDRSWTGALQPYQWYR
jgi:hypothetical protein